MKEEAKPVMSHLPIRMHGPADVDLFAVTFPLPLPSSPKPTEVTLVRGPRLALSGRMHLGDTMYCAEFRTFRVNGR